MNFDKIDYLIKGNDRQRDVYNLLTKNQILTKLHLFDPILVGTIPINIDIESSDLDIICYYKEKKFFITELKEMFGDKEGFKIHEYSIRKQHSIIANFEIENFKIEIFGQNIPTREQYAYRHMLIESRLINERGELFKQKIIALKKEGYKTEAAFANLLGLKGDPYNELLSYEKRIING